MIITLKGGGLPIKGLKLFLINMMPATQISFLTVEYLGIFILMFSTFLIGYFSSWWMQKNKYQAKIKTLRKRINLLIKSNKSIFHNKDINEIETLFTVVKPRMQAKVDHDNKEELGRKSKKSVAEKARTSYITYTKTKPKLNFDNFGVATIEERDDLSKLNGIGPYIEQKLNEIGIFTYDQICRFKMEDIRKITILIDFFPDRIERDDWVGQAKNLKIKK